MFIASTTPSKAVVESLTPLLSTNYLRDYLHLSNPLYYVNT